MIFTTLVSMARYIEKHTRRFATTIESMLWKIVLRLRIILTKKLPPLP